MARIRTTKPEFWGDEKLAPLSPITRLVFLGLIGMADDAGRLVDNEKVIDAFIFPETSETSRGSIGELSAIGRIVRGKTKSGQRIIQITNWTRHQKIDRPNPHSCLPEIVEEEPVADLRRELDESSSNARRRGNDVPSTDLGPRTLDLGEDLGHGSTPPPPARAREDFLAQAPNPTAWRARFDGWLEGNGWHNGKRLDPADLDIGLSDYLLATETPDFNPRHVKRFVEKAEQDRLTRKADATGATVRTGPGRKLASGEQTYLTALAVTKAIDDRARATPSESQPSPQKALG